MIGGGLVLAGENVWWNFQLYGLYPCLIQEEECGASSCGGVIIIWRQTPYTTVTKFLNLTWQCGRFNGTKFKV